MGIGSDRLCCPGQPVGSFGVDVVEILIAPGLHQAGGMDHDVGPVTQSPQRTLVLKIAGRHLKPRDIANRSDGIAPCQHTHGPARVGKGPDQTPA